MHFSADDMRERKQERKREGKKKFRDRQWRKELQTMKGETWKQAIVCRQSKGYKLSAHRSLLSSPKFFGGFRLVLQKQWVG